MPSLVTTVQQQMHRQKLLPTIGIALLQLIITVMIDVLPLISAVQLRTVASQLRIPVQALLRLVLAHVEVGTCAVKL